MTEHLIVVDGEERVIGAAHQIKSFPASKVIVLPAVTGAHGFQGHRVYAAMPIICDAEYICYLDEDNWIEPTHVESLVALLETFTLDWVYSLRNIVSCDGKFVCRDDCNSLGRWPSYDGNYQHIDTSCYLLKRALACKLTSLWNHSDLDAEGAADRLVAKHLMANFPLFHTTGNYSVNYRIGSRISEAGSIRFYKTGNEIQHSIYRHFPWNILKIKGLCPYHPHLEYCVDESDEVLIGGPLFRELKDNLFNRAATL